MLVGSCPLGPCLLSPRWLLRWGLAAAAGLCAAALPVSAPPELSVTGTGEAQHLPGSYGSAKSLPPLGTSFSAHCGPRTGRVRLCTCLHVCRHVRIYMYVYIYVYVYIFTRVCNSRLNWLCRSMPSVLMNSYPFFTGSGLGRTLVPGGVGGDARSPREGVLHGPHRHRGELC